MSATRRVAQLGVAVAQRPARRDQRAEVRLLPGAASSATDGNSQRHRAARELQVASVCGASRRRTVASMPQSIGWAVPIGTGRYSAISSVTWPVKPSGVHAVRPTAPPGAHDPERLGGGDLGPRREHQAERAA